MHVLGGGGVEVFSECMSWGGGGVEVFSECMSWGGGGGLLSLFRGGGGGYVEVFIEHVLD